MGVSSGFDFDTVGRRKADDEPDTVGQNEAEDESDTVNGPKAEPS